MWSTYFFAYLYGLGEPTSWEDFALYEKNEDNEDREEYRHLKGLFTITTSPYLRLFTSDGTEEDEKHQAELDRFFAKNELEYRYYYSECCRDDEDFYELPFDLPVNEQGFKPRSLEIWYPSEGITEEVLTTCIRDFCERFYGYDDPNFQYLKVPLRESVIESMNELATISGIAFTDELIEQVSKEYGITKEEAEIKLRKSCGLPDAEAK
jgi:hypothetical protein